MPNGEDKKLNFIAKVYDPVTQTYRPLYIAPDATDKVQGDVFLTDIIDETKNAAEGMTAITPAAVKGLADKLEKDINEASTYRKLSVGSEIIPIYLDNGDFKEVKGLDASSIISGTIALERLPQGALERLVPVENREARFNLTKEQVQLGDIVQELDTHEMYVVVDEENLDNDSGYTVFSAGIATLAEAANKLANSITINGVPFDGSESVTIYDDTKLPLSGGTLTGNLTGQYITGTWLRSTATTDLNRTPERYPVFDGSGWLYYRTFDETQTDLDILKKSGDTTTGKLTIGNGMSIAGNAIPANSTPSYFITMDAFSDGGEIKYSTLEDTANYMWDNSFKNKIDEMKETMFYLGRNPVEADVLSEWVNLGTGYALITEDIVHCSSESGILVNYSLTEGTTFQVFYAFNDCCYIRHAQSSSGPLMALSLSEWKRTYPSGSDTVAGASFSSSPSLLVEDSSASSGYSINIATGSNQLIGTSKFDVPFGSYSIVVRAQVSNITNSTDVFQIVILSNDTIIKTVNVKPTYFTAANTWLPIGTGVNFGGTSEASLVVQIKSLGSTATSAKIDNITVMSAPVAVNMIG